MTTEPTITITEAEASTALGALPGYAGICPLCGMEITSSLQTLAEHDARRHLAWHDRQAKKGAERHAGLQALIETEPLIPWAGAWQGNEWRGADLQAGTHLVRLLLDDGDVIMHVLDGRLFLTYTVRFGVGTPMAVAAHAVHQAIREVV
jgi:hypothetical protein